MGKLENKEIGRKFPVPSWAEVAVSYNRKYPDTRSSFSIQHLIPSIEFPEFTGRVLNTGTVPTWSLVSSGHPFVQWILEPGRVMMMIFYRRYFVFFPSER